MTKDISTVLEQCEVCEKFKSTKPPPKSTIPLEDGKLYQRWAIDLIGPMPLNDQGYKFIITAVDFSAWWLVIRASKSHKAKNISLFIGSEISKKFRNPSIIMADCEC